MKHGNRANARDRILDAAEEIVIKRGVLALTLDAVAGRAGISKGGLLYHFPSKEAVVQGMVSRVEKILHQRFALLLAAAPPGRGRHARTLLRLMTEKEGSLFSRLQKVAGPLLAAAVNNPELLKPMQGFFKGVLDGMIADGLPPDRSWLVLAALDGVKFWRIFNNVRPSRADLEGLRILLVQVIEGSTRGTNKELA